MDRDLVTTLRVVIDLGTVVSAASHLHLTPSAVSQQLARLRREVDVELFVRRGRYLKPTDAAKILAEAATEMDIADAKAMARLEELQGEPNGVVRIGAFPTACRGLIGPVVAEISSRYPKLSLVVHELYPEVGVEETVKGNIDIAVVHDWEDVHLVIPSVLSATDLGKDDADLIVPAGHAASRRRTVSIADLPGERWITDTTHIYARWLQHSLEKARIPYEMAGLVDEHESQIMLTSYGLGLSIVPRLGRGPLPEGAVAVALTERAPRRRLMRVERTDTVDRPALRIVREVIDRQTQSILECTGRAAPPP